MLRLREVGLKDAGGNLVVDWKTSGLAMDIETAKKLRIEHSGEVKGQSQADAGEGDARPTVTSMNNIERRCMAALTGMERSYITARPNGVKPIA